MNTKLLSKLTRLEDEIDTCMDAMDNCYSDTEENKLAKMLDKLEREKRKLEKKINRHEELS